ncbi:hypothetical protein DFH27DRAFT_546786 [Peziza echinospora]|nr:hypothetical protein DFH27DRAFT_546786 [Peziza echinospora]
MLNMILANYPELMPEQMHHCFLSACKLSRIGSGYFFFLPRLLLAWHETTWHEGTGDLEDIWRRDQPGNKRLQAQKYPNVWTHLLYIPNCASPVCSVARHMHCEHTRFFWPSHQCSDSLRPRPSRPGNRSFDFNPLENWGRSGTFLCKTYLIVHICSFTGLLFTGFPRVWIHQAISS